MGYSIATRSGTHSCDSHAAAPGSRLPIASPGSPLNAIRASIAGQITCVNRSISI
jgi:hypothetical protein